MASMCKSTTGQYNTHLKSFERFCDAQDHRDYLNIQCNLGIEFLTNMFEAGASYSSINTARSAISQFVNLTDSQHQFGKHPLTTRFMKGVYKLRPPLPKYNATWNVSPVLNLLESLDISSLKNLSMKCLMLIALSTGQRVQTLSILDLALMKSNDEKFVFLVRNVIKTSKPGRSHKVEIHKYKGGRPGICPFICLQKYLEKTKVYRKSNKLFLSYLKPHKAVGSQTISRWITMIMKKAGVDNKFGSHSVRHAASSKAWDVKIPIDSILSTVGWSSEKTFASFYRREIIPDSKDFAEAVLND